MKDPTLNDVDSDQGAKAALVFINGFATKKDVGPITNTKWLSAVREAGWRGSVHHLWWASSKMNRFPWKWGTVRDRAERVGAMWLAGFLVSKDGTTDRRGDGESDPSIQPLRVG